MPPVVHEVVFSLLFIVAQRIGVLPLAPHDMRGPYGSLCGASHSTPR